MVNLNVSFGLYALMPPGWIFMALVVIIEAFFATKYLTHKKGFSREETLSVLLSNFVSGIVGIVASICANGGWWLVLWLPWVTPHEVSVNHPIVWLLLVGYYLIAFILSVVIESLVNMLVLRGKYSRKLIFKCTFRINVISYIIGSLLLYPIGYILCS